MRYSYLSMLAFLLLFTAACGEDDPVTPQHQHADAIGMAVTNSGVVVASILRGVPSDTLQAAVGVLTDHYAARFYDEDEDLFEVHDDDKTFSWEITDPTILEVVQDAGEEGSFDFHLKGLKPGVTTIEFFIMHEGHADFRTGKWPVVVL